LIAAFPQGRTCNGTDDDGDGLVDCDDWFDCRKDPACQAPIRFERPQLLVTG